MAINCDPNALAQAAKCFPCLPDVTNFQAQTYLLAVLAGGSTDANTLAQQAKGLSGLSDATLGQIKALLLCRIAGGT